MEQKGLNSSPNRNANDSKNEESLVRKSAKGDRKAFSELVEEYKKPVYFFAFRLAGNHADADDVAQTTFLKAFQKLSQFEPGTNLRSWLFAIAANAATDLVRRKGTRREVELTVDPAAPASKAETPEGAAIGKENGELIWRALSGLPADQRAVLVMHAMEGVSLADISRDMKWPEGTVRWRFLQARKKMKERLRGTGLDFELEPAVDGEETNG